MFNNAINTFLIQIPVDLSKTIRSNKVQVERGFTFVKKFTIFNFSSIPSDYYIHSELIMERGLLVTHGIICFP